MPLALQIGTLVLSMVGATTGLIFTLSRLNFRRAKIRAINPADQARADDVSRIVHRGVQVATWPTYCLGVGGVIVVRHVSVVAFAVMLVCIVVLGAGWHMFAVRRWWRWALAQHPDVMMLEGQAEAARLVYRHDTWIGRRQRRSWMTLPPGMEPDPDAPGSVGPPPAEEPPHDPGE